MTDTIILMGVSGCGKTTIGRALAARIDAEFIDADDHHPPANVARMAAGIPLDDADREPWLAALNVLLRARAGEGRSVVLACSALRERYRAALLHGISQARVVHLHAETGLLRLRLAERRNHYMPSSLLDSQLATLEPPAAAITVDVSASVEACVSSIVSRLALGTRGRA